MSVRVLGSLLITSLLVGCAARRPYWGDVHGHTNLSDGQGSVDEYFAHARDIADLDFVIVTDHDFGAGPPWRMSPATWQSVQDAADRYDRAGEFVALAGYEWTSASKYWKSPDGSRLSEGLFDGPPRYYGHKNVYFPNRVDELFSAKDLRSNNPDRLAEVVAASGGLIHTNHPSLDPEAREQWSYDARHAAVIANTEIAPDLVRHEGREYETGMERAVRAFLDAGGRVGFVAGSDTHVGHPQARTAVYADSLTREGVLDALRRRRCYAVTGARIVLRFSIDDQPMGADIEIDGKPRLEVRVEGTAPIQTLEIIRDGVTLRSVSPGTRTARLTFVDESFSGDSYYYVRVTQADRDDQGNPSRAWSSPIWVRARPEGPPER